MTQTLKPRFAVDPPSVLLAAFIAFWVAMAIAPLYRKDWLLENVLVFIAVPILILGYRRLRFSNGAYVCVFLFLVCHEVGAHYTYSEVPYAAWLSRWPMPLLGAHRNDYDRLVHFLYGLLITPASSELIAAVASPRGAWRWLLPVTFIMSHSLLYELIEWGAALTFGGDLGIAYLGTQGDPWDAQRDMLAATVGSLIAIVAVSLRRYRANGRHSSGCRMPRDPLADNRDE
jgi:putative membrane protein